MPNPEVLHLYISPAISADPALLPLSSTALPFLSHPLSSLPRVCPLLPTSWSSLPPSLQKSFLHQMSFPSCSSISCVSPAPPWGKPAYILNYTQRNRNLYVTCSGDSDATMPAFYLLLLGSTKANPERKKEERFSWYSLKLQRNALVRINQDRGSAQLPESHVPTETPISSLLTFTSGTTDRGCRTLLSQHQTLWLEFCNAGNTCLKSRQLTHLINTKIGTHIPSEVVFVSFHTEFQGDAYYLIIYLHRFSKYSISYVQICLPWGTHLFQGRIVIASKNKSNFWLNKEIMYLSDLWGYRKY